MEVMNVPAIADRGRNYRMTKDELITWAKANGFTEDRFGHLQKSNGTSRYRLKLSSIAARYDVKTSAGFLSEPPQWRCRTPTAFSRSNFQRTASTSPD